MKSVIVRKLFVQMNIKQLIINCTSVQWSNKCTYQESTIINGRICESYYSQIKRMDSPNLRKGVSKWNGHPLPPWTCKYRVERAPSSPFYLMSELIQWKLYLNIWTATAGTAITGLFSLSLIWNWSLLNAQVFAAYNGQLPDFLSNIKSN